MINIRDLIVNQGFAKAILGSGGGNTQESIETTIAPDFSNGNMEVLPGEGEVYSKVTVEKPETLIPENIAEGIDVAGVVGTLLSGKTAKVSVGTLVGTTESKTINHKLGDVPSLVIIYPYSLMGSNTGRFFQIGYGSAMEKLLPTYTFQRLLTISRSTSTSTPLSMQSDSGKYIDTVGSGTIFISADETSFTVAALLKDYYYYWIAIGGLT